MKTSSWSLLMLVGSITMIALTGCGGEPKVSSVTECVEMSEMEAYEQSVRAMEVAGTMDMDDSGE